MHGRKLSERQAEWPSNFDEVKVELAQAHFLSATDGEYLQILWALFAIYAELEEVDEGILQVIES